MFRNLLSRTCAEPVSLRSNSILSLQKQCFHRSAASGSISSMFSKPVKEVKWNKPLEPGKVSDTLTVPDCIEKPPYLTSSITPMHELAPVIHDQSAIAAMRQSCAAASYIREFAGQFVKAGVTTDEIDKRVHAEVLRLGIYPSPLHYSGFPKSICTSLNQVVCHGIPDDRPLEDGDSLNIDVSVYFNGHHGDCSTMYTVGEVDEDGLRLIKTARYSLDEAIKICKPGLPFNEIGSAIHDIVEAEGFEVVKRFAGHGIGQHFHMSPLILHYPNTYSGVMQEGNIFTIEPVIVEGSEDSYEWSDQWTAVTKDGGRAAQFEETILITSEGAEILTQHNNEDYIEPIVHHG